MRVQLVWVMISAFIAMIAHSSRSGAAEGRGVVEGDRSLLDLLIAAQATGRSSFPHGALDAQARNVRPGQIVEVESRVVWDGPSTYWNYKQIVRNRGRDPEISKGEMIETRDIRFHYWPEYKLAQIIGNNKYGYRPELRLRPEQRWFQTGVGRELSDMFDVGTAERPPKVDNFQRLIVRREHDEIIVSRHINGGVFEIRASLRAGGNVVGYDVTTPMRDDPEWCHGTYDWLELPDKRWRLKRHEGAFSSRGNSKNPEHRYELTVTTFDPEPVIAPDRFSFESLHVPPGTLVENVSAAGTNSQRQGQVMPTQDQLDGLAEQLRKAGFAAPSQEDH